MRSWKVYLEVNNLRIFFFLDQNLPRSSSGVLRWFLSRGLMEEKIAKLVI